MTTKLDLKKMEAAFKRAAHKALHGTREERSGKFLPKNRSSVDEAKRDPRAARSSAR